jgi:hypothetical protein
MERIVADYKSLEQKLEAAEQARRPPRRRAPFRRELAVPPTHLRKALRRRARAQALKAAQATTEAAKKGEDAKAKEVSKLSSGIADIQRKLGESKAHLEAASREAASLDKDVAAARELAGKTAGELDKAREALKSERKSFAAAVAKALEAAGASAPTSSNTGSDSGSAKPLSAEMEEEGGEKGGEEEGERPQDDGAAEA